MKKIFILMMTLMMSLGVANAQIATENAKFFDNWYVGVGGQASTSLNFKDVFPLNGSFAVTLGKELTPVFGINVEDNVWFSSHIYAVKNTGTMTDPKFDYVCTRFDFLGANTEYHNAVRANYLGLNGTVNFSNLFWGYQGKPRTVELQGVVGLGWWHVFTPNQSDKMHDDLGAKTGLNLSFNLGNKKAHTIYIQPNVLWNLTTPHSKNNKVAFNRNGAQFGVQVGYVYHFKTSNRTHYFKTYDVGAMLSEIDALRADLAKKPNEVVVEKVVTKEVTVTENVNETVVYFAFDSEELDERAKETLNKLGENGVYDVAAYASSEGTTEYNKALSQRRADAVKEYLEGRGCKVNSSTGYGVMFGTTTGRVAVVTVK